jgi:hypothetical protein
MRLYNISFSLHSRLLFLSALDQLRELAVKTIGKFHVFGTLGMSPAAVSDDHVDIMR